MEFAMNGISPMYFYLCQCFLLLQGMTSHGDLGYPFQTAQVERRQISAFTTMIINLWLPFLRSGLPTHLPQQRRTASYRNWDHGKICQFVNVPCKCRRDLNYQGGSHRQLSGKMISHGAPTIFCVHKNPSLKCPFLGRTGSDRSGPTDVRQDPPPSIQSIKFSLWRSWNHRSSTNFASLHQCLPLD